MNKFNIPLREAKLIDVVSKALDENVSLIGGGKYSKACSQWFVNYFSCKEAILTSSCTDALEMSCSLLNLSKGDEVIVPNYTFVSSALPFANAKCTIRFVDIDDKSLCSSLDNYISALNKNTKAFVAVNYGGINPHIKEIQKFCNENSIYLIEDAAQSLGAEIDGVPFGSFGDLATLSFHDTKNINSGGEGGALIINNESFLPRAYYLAEKGTNRHDFFNGKIDKYTWVDNGSSHVMSDLNASILYANLELVEKVTNYRRELWNLYHENLKDIFKTQHKYNNIQNNGHLFYILCEDEKEREGVEKFLNYNKIQATTHYNSLFDSPFSQNNIHIMSSNIEVSRNIATRLLRLPMHYYLQKDSVVEICNKLKKYKKNA